MVTKPEEGGRNTKQKVHEPNTDTPVLSAGKEIILSHKSCFIDLLCELLDDAR